MKISTKNKITPKLHKSIVEMLVQYNSEKVNNSEYINEPLEIIIENDYRNRGIGSKLIAEAENEALKRNCNFITLDTFSFQAPEFYEKKSFEKIGTETNFPMGHEKYYYLKKLK